MKRATSLLFAMFLLSAYLWGQGTTGTLSGYVIEAVQGPIANVRVFTGTYEAFTNAAGFYQIGTIEAGSYDVGFQKTGYISQTVPGVQIIADDTTHLDKTLEFTPPVLNSATVFQYSVSLQFTGNPVLAQYGLPMMAGFQGGSGLDEIQVHPLDNSFAGNQTLEDELPGDQTIITPTSVNPVDAPAAVGDNCNDPIVIPSFPYTDVNTTCGRLDDYNATCLNNFDQGEDIVYQFVLTAPKKIVATLSNVANKKAGMLITAECPIGQNCIASIGNTNASKTLTVNLEPGTYYIEIDRRDVGACINTFNLSVTAEDPTPGSMCSVAVTAQLGNNVMPITTNSTTSYWWEYTPATDCSIKLNTCTANNAAGYLFAFNLKAYDGCGGNLVAGQVQNNDNGSNFCNLPGQITTTLVFNAQAGVSIKFRWGNALANANFTLETGPVILPSCPPDAIPEPELCGENLNGGCYGGLGGVYYGDNDFTPITIGNKICGKEFTAPGNIIDKDYYKLVINEPKTLTWSVTAQFPVQIFIANGNSGCPGIANPNYVLQRAYALPGQPATLTRTVLPGTYHLYIGIEGFYEGYPCNGFQANRYVAELTGVTADLPYIKIYRDNVYVGQSYFSTFTDQMVPAGPHCYKVSHYFPGGETQMSNEICVNVLTPAELNVSPTSLSETLEVGATSTQVLNISNTGGSPMNWQACLGFQNITPPPAMVPAVKQMVPAGQPGIIKADFTIKNSVLGGEPGPKETSSLYTLNYDGVNSIGIGTDSGPFNVAARYPAPMASQYTGFSLVSVDLYFLVGASSTILYIWGPGTATSPGTLIYQQAFTPPTIEGWLTVTLTTPVPLNGADIWVGYQLTNGTGFSPAGADAGPANIDGEWVSLDAGVSWDRISALVPGWSFNWNIRANVSSEIYNWLTITPSSGTVLPGQSTNVMVSFNASDLATGNYNAYINASNFGQWNGNSKSVPVVLSVTPSILALSAMVTNVSCNGAINGAIDLTVTGGLPPYAYLWSNTATTEDISMLAAGTYTVTVTDAISTNVIGTWTVTGPEAIILNATIVPATCPGTNDGSIDLTVSGGTPDYNYLWTNGAITQDLAGLLPGDYMVTVTDFNACQQNGTWTISENSPVCANITVTGDITATACYDATDTITVAGNGNTFVVQPAGSVTFIAGLTIFYLPGTTVLPGGYMLDKITSPTGPFCNTPLPIAASVTTGRDERPFATGRSFFSIYPNPTNGNFTIMQKGERQCGNVKVEVYNMSGKKVLTDNMIGLEKHEILITGLPSGLYFVKVVADDYVETIKLVKL